MVDRNAIIRQIQIARKFGARKPRRIAARPRYPYVLERKYQRILREYVGNYVKIVRETILARLPDLAKEADRLRPDGLHEDSWVTDVTELIQSIRSKLDPQIKKTQKKADDLVNEVSDFNKKDVDRVIRSVVGVNIFTQEPWLKDQLEAFLSQNRALIKGLTDRETEQIQTIALNGLVAGDTAETMGKRIKKRFGITQRRAELIARDQVATMNGVLAGLRQTAAGVTQFIWRTALDERVRELHEEREGEVYDWDHVFDETPDDGPPGIPINCFPGSVNFKSLDCVSKLYGHCFRGHLTELVTENDLILQATPNHPVLTDRGWVAINKVNVGDYLICGEGKAIDAIKVNVDHRMSFENCFSSLSVIFGFSIHPSRTLADFHGDMADNKVGVISLDSSLPSSLDAELINDFVKLIFAWAKVPGIAGEFPFQGGFLSALQSLFGTPDSVVCGFNKLLALFVTGKFHAVEHGFRSISRLHPVFYEPIFYNISGNLVSFCDFFNAKPFSKEAQQFMNRQLYSIMRRSITQAGYRRVDPRAPKMNTEIISVNTELDSNLEQAIPFVKKGYRVSNKRISEFSGHVYNFETLSGYYGIQGDNSTMIVSNCRCIAEPVLDDLLEAI